MWGGGVYCDDTYQLFYPSGHPVLPGYRYTNQMSQQRAQSVASAWQSHIRGDKLMCGQSIYIRDPEESNNKTPGHWAAQWPEHMWADITSYQPRKVLSSLYWDEEAGSSMCNSSTNSGGWNHPGHTEPYRAIQRMVQRGTRNQTHTEASSPSQQNPDD